MSISTCWSEGLGPKVFYADIKYPVRALCGTEPATGLYVAFRVLPADTGGSKTAQAVKVTYAPSEEKPETEEDRARREEEEKAARRFTLAFVDADGFLQPVTDTNPWHELHSALQFKATEWEAHAKKWGAKKVNKGVPPPPLPPQNRNPDSIKLLPKTRFEACLVRHPSAHLALALCKWLNGEGDPHEYGFETWGAPESLLRKFDVDTDRRNGVLSFSLSSAPGDYYPPGPKRYGGWTLYVDMPLASVPTVVDAVKRLQDDLGRLRYPVGGNSPYGGSRVGAHGEVKDSVNYGTFDLLAASAVYSFQLHASYGVAFQLADKALAYTGALVASDKPARDQPKNSWAYLIGWTVKRPPLLDQEKVDWGVVDVATSAAIRKWLEEGLRKPGQVLVELPSTDRHTEKPLWVDWARPELAFAFELWREFTWKLGGTYGLSFTHIFRDAGAAGGVGRAECSIHKTGNAVDLAVKGSLVSGNENVVDFSQPASYFPIRFEASWNWDSRSQVGKLKREVDRAEKELDRARSAAKPKLKTRVSNTTRDVQDAKAKVAEAGKGKVKVPSFKDDVISKRITLSLDATSLGTHLATLQSRLAHLQRLSAELERGDLSESILPGEPTLPEVAKVRTAQGRLKAAREQYARATQDDVPVRSAFRINWRLYEHSTLHAFAYSPDRLAEEVAKQMGAPPAELRAQPEVRWGIETQYRSLLRSYVPAPSGLLLARVTGAAFLGPQEDYSPPPLSPDAAPDDILLPGVDPVPSTETLERLNSASWEDLVEGMIDARPEVKRCRDVAQTLVGMGGQMLLSTLFQDEIQQFIYNPFEADGGRDGPKIKPSADADGVLDYFDQTEEARRVGVTRGAKCFLNLTVLAFHCGLLRIGANRGGWRDPRSDPGRKVKAPYQKLKVDGQLGPLAGLIERMDAPETGLDDDFFFVISKEGRVAHWVKAVDKSFLLAWARELKKGAGAKATQRKTKGPAAVFPEPSGKTISSRMVLNLSVREDEQQQVRDLLNAFPNKRFRVTHVGHTVKHIPEADLVKGSTLLTQYNEALKGFLDELRARAEREQEAAKAAKAPKAKGQAQGSAKPVDKKPVPSQPRKPDDWTLILQPYFDLENPPPGATEVLTQDLLKVNDAITGPLTVGPGDVLEIPTPGVGRALEWWHYETEHANRTSWGQLLEEIGYAQPVFAATAMPPRLILPRRYLSRGYDFDPAEQLNGIKGGGVIGILPENVKPKVAPPDSQETAGVLPPAASAGG